MRVLITGAAGFIGSHLLRHLIRRGDRVLGIVQAAARSSDASMRRSECLSAELGKSALSECADSKDLRRSIQAFDPEACVHLAGRSSVRESFENPALYEEANCRGTLQLLEALKGSPCRRFVNASTVMVYGPNASAPCREDNLGCGPLSFYGASKLAAETLVNQARRSGCLESINLRFFSVYGPELREDCVPYLIGTSLLRKTVFNILGDGSSQRDYVNILDVLTAVAKALSVPWDPQFPTTLNIGSGSGTSLNRLIEMFENTLDCRLLKNIKPAVAGETQSIVADVSLAGKVLAYQPAVSLDEGLRNLADWLRATVKV